MPQMSPMWWTSLMMMFILSFLIMNSMLYFTKKYNLKKVIKQTSNNQKNWKW